MNKNALISLRGIRVDFDDEPVLKVLPEVLVDLAAEVEDLVERLTGALEAAL